MQTTVHLGRPRGEAPQIELVPQTCMGDRDMFNSWGTNQTLYGATPGLRLVALISNANKYDSEAEYMRLRHLDSNARSDERERS